jgi:hypothetical protein
MIQTLGRLRPEAATSFTRLSTVGLCGRGAIDSAGGPVLAIAHRSRDAPQALMKLMRHNDALLVVVWASRKAQR